MRVVDEESNRYLLDAHQKLEGRLPKDPTQPFWLFGVPEVEDQAPDAYRGHDPVKVLVLRAIDGVYLVGTGDSPPELEVALPTMPRYLPIYPVVPLALAWLVSGVFGYAGRVAFGYLASLALVSAEGIAWGVVKSWYPELSNSAKKRA